MPPKDAYSIILTTEEEARIMLWALRYAVNSWFSVEQEEKNVVTWHADKLENSINERAFKKERIEMNRLLANAKSFDEVNAILEKRGTETETEEERRLKTEEMYQNTLKQLEEQRLRNLANENTGESGAEVHD
jgi:hypothetical protein